MSLLCLPRPLSWLCLERDLLCDGEELNSNQLSHEKGRVILKPSPGLNLVILRDAALPRRVELTKKQF